MADQKISALDEITTLNGDELVPVVDDPSGTIKTVYITANNAATFFRSFDGWIAAGETWTYASASTFTVSGDVSAKYGPGDKLKLTQTTVKYFYVLSAVYSSPNTTITVTGGSNYTVANAAITSPYYSHGNPIGFPKMAYTPTWTASSSNPSIGNGSISGSFVVEGRKVTSWMQVTIGSTSSAGSGYYTFSLPITPSSGITYTGNIQINDTSAGTRYIGAVVWNGAGGVFAVTTAGLVTNASPMAPATGDEYTMSIQYLI